MEIQQTPWLIGLQPVRASSGSSSSERWSINLHISPRHDILSQTRWISCWDHLDNRISCGSQCPGARQVLRGSPNPFARRGFCGCFASSATWCGWRCGSLLKISQSAWCQNSHDHDKRWIWSINFNTLMITINLTKFLLKYFSRWVHPRFEDVACWPVSFWFSEYSKDWARWARLGKIGKRKLMYTWWRGDVAVKYQLSKMVHLQYIAHRIIFCPLEWIEQPRSENHGIPQYFAMNDDETEKIHVPKFSDPVGSSIS